MSPSSDSSRIPRTIWFPNRAAVAGGNCHLESRLPPRTVFTWTTFRVARATTAEEFEPLTGLRWLCDGDVGPLCQMGVRSSLESPENQKVGGSALLCRASGNRSSVAAAGRKGEEGSDPPRRRVDQCPRTGGNRPRSRVARRDRGHVRLRAVPLDAVSPDARAASGASVSNSGTAAAAQVEAASNALAVTVSMTRASSFRLLQGLRGVGGREGVATSLLPTQPELVLPRVTCRTGDGRKLALIAGGVTWQRRRRAIPNPGVVRSNRAGGILREKHRAAGRLGHRHLPVQVRPNLGH